MTFLFRENRTRERDGRTDVVQHLMRFPIEGLIIVNRRVGWLHNRLSFDAQPRVRLLGPMPEY